jgi:DNA-binding XRE family transcriptional regulator
MEPSGVVYLAPYDAAVDTANGEGSQTVADQGVSKAALWSGYWEVNGSMEFSPEFNDPDAAVEWGRARANAVYIRMYNGPYIWAGMGSPPSDEPVQLYDSFDFQNRLDQSRENADAILQVTSALIQFQEEFAAGEVGKRLQEIRTEAGLSVEEVASRLKVSPNWLIEIEAGIETLKVLPETWIDIAWAVSNPWPDPRRGRNAVSTGWIAASDELLEMAIRQRLKDIST